MSIDAVLRAVRLANMRLHLCVTLMTLTVSRFVTETIQTATCTSWFTLCARIIAIDIALQAGALVGCRTMCVHTFLLTARYTRKSNQIIVALLAFANVRCTAVTVRATSLTQRFTLSQGTQPQLVTILTATLIGSLTHAILTGLFTDGRTQTQRLVTLIAEITRTFPRRITTPIGAIRQTSGLAFSSTAVDEIVAIIAGARLRFNALPINTRLTAFRLTYRAIPQIQIAFGAEAYIGTHALACLTVHALRQTIAGFCIANITFTTHLVHARVGLFDRAQYQGIGGWTTSWTLRTYWIFAHCHER